MLDPRSALPPAPPVTGNERMSWLPGATLRERLVHLAKVTLRETRRGPSAWWSAVRAAARLVLPGARRSGSTELSWPTEASLPHFPGMEPDLVSVVLPVYNQAPLLGDAIASVLAQTHTALELIVVSDGSTDAVEAVVDRFDDGRIRFLVQPNQKLPKALSNGFDFARGEFWTWTSADNLMEPSQLARLVAFLRRRPDVDLVFADYWAIDDRGQMLVDPAFRPPNRRTPTSPEIHLPRDTTGYGEGADNYIGPCFLYRGLAGRVLGDYAPELGVEDFDYWLRMHAALRIAHLGTDELLYRYRVHDNSLGAHAQELGIYQRRDHLVALHARRRQDLSDPWHTTVDAKLEGALGRGRRRPSSLVDGHTVRVVTPEKLAAVRAATPHAHVVAWFDDSDPEAPYRHRLALLNANACIAADAITGDRLALFTDDAYVAPDRSVVRAFAELHAKAARLRTLEQVPEKWRRTWPRVRLPHDRALRVLLQVDRFAHDELEQVVLDLGRTLRAAGAEVRLLVREAGIDAVARARAVGLSVVSFAADSDERQYVELLDAGFDVVNAHDWPFGADLADARGTRFVQTLHNDHASPNAAAVRDSIAATAVFTCASAEAARYADLVLGVPPAKLIVMANGIAQQVRLFQWLAAGGRLTSARVWLRHPHDVSSPLHSEQQ